MIEMFVCSFASLVLWCFVWAVYIICQMIETLRGWLDELVIYLKKSALVKTPPMSLRSLVLVFLTLLPLSRSYSPIQFNERHSRSIRRKEFYEITSGPHAYFVLYYIDNEPECRTFARGWSDIAEEYADRDDIVFLQVDHSF